MWIILCLLWLYHIILSVWLQENLSLLALHCKPTLLAKMWGSSFMGVDNCYCFEICSFAFLSDNIFFVVQLFWAGWPSEVWGLSPRKLGAAFPTHLKIVGSLPGWDRSNHIQYILCVSHKHTHTYIYILSHIYNEKVFSVTIKILLPCT